MLRDVTPQELLVVLSMLMRGERGESDAEGMLKWAEKQSEGLGNVLRTLFDITERVTAVEREVELQDEAVTLESRLTLHLGRVVWGWAGGEDFGEISRGAGLDEGSIVKAIMRLESGCRDVGSAARVMGNARLGERVEAARGLIKRDIIFAPSLYIN